MSVAILPSTPSDAFSEYRPSKNAHIDFLSTSTASTSTEKAGVRRIKLDLRARTPEPSSRELLSTLVQSIAPLTAGQSTKHSFHHLSSTCHKLVLPPHSLGPTIYTRVKEELEGRITSLARGWRASIMGREPGWLARLITGWRTWESRVGLLAAVFVYLDRVYANGSNGIASIKTLAIATFRKGIWENDVLFQKTRDDFLSWVTDEREKLVPNTELRPTIIALTALAKLMPAFASLSDPYIDLTTSHYGDAAQATISSVEGGNMSPTKYVDWLLEKVVEERERAEACLDGTVAGEVVKVVRSEGGEKMSKRIVRIALGEAMDLADTKALDRLHQFSIDVNVFGELSRALEDHVEARLRVIISDPANDSQMIDGSLKLKRFADSAIEGLFRDPAQTPAQQVKGLSNDGFADLNMDEPVARRVRGKERIRQLELQEAVRNGFKKGMGSRQNAPAEWIAKHLDAAMRKGQGAGTEAEFNALLDEIIALIGFTKDKDVFRAFYATQLAKRLLLNKSASDDMERNMIIKLQKEMGEEFTTGDVMMKDLQLSENLVKSYQTTLAKDPSIDPAATSLTANVLTESAWPAYPLLKDGWAFKLPPELQSSIDAFSSWYGTQHKNRQLSWRWQLASVTMSARFASGKYEIGLSLFQAVVLLLFNEEDTLDFTEMKERSGIEANELVRTLQSLSLGRKGTRVLLKKPPGKEVSPTDVFAFNKAFTSDRIKFRINQIQQDMSAEESRKTNEQVAIDRVSVLEATIVRIMKARKKLTLQLLIDAVVTDVSKRFPPDVKEIKKRVESLIEREFLARDEEDRNVLNYLA